MKAFEGKKKILVLGILCLILIGVVILVMAKLGAFKADDNNIENSGNIGENQKVEEQVSNDDGYVHIKGIKTVGGIEFSNIRIGLVSENKCEFLADVKNVTDGYLESTNIRIKVIDHNGEVDKVFGGIVTELAAGEPNKFKTMVLSDVTHAQDIELEVISQ